ncbi:MAG TPA: hypothetical protein VN802_01440 [Stellaceae bacterium]|nr:hypothetical protein [Stellaceae bacterium]
MQVTQELVTVMADPLTGEVNLVLAGYRIVLTTGEAALLAKGLVSSLERLRDQAAAEAAPASESWQVERTLSDAEAMEQRTRALIQAKMREKGLSLREEDR